MYKQIVCCHFTLDLVLGLLVDTVVLALDWGLGLGLAAVVAATLGLDLAAVDDAADFDCTLGLDFEVTAAFFPLVLGLDCAALVLALVFGLSLALAESTASNPIRLPVT